MKKEQKRSTIFLIPTSVSSLPFSVSFTLFFNKEPQFDTWPHLCLNFKDGNVLKELHLFPNFWTETLD